MLNLTPDENVFHDGWLRFYLSQDTLTFQKIDLQGRALSFIGDGQMNMHDKKLDITLLARSPVRIRIPLITDALEIFSREMMEVHISGTADQPTIRPKPLRSLTKFFQLLFPPPPPKTPTGQPPTPPPIEKK